MINLKVTVDEKDNSVTFQNTSKETICFDTIGKAPLPAPVIVEPNGAIVLKFAKPDRRI